MTTNNSKKPTFNSQEEKEEIVVICAERLVAVKKELSSAFDKLSKVGSEELNEIFQKGVTLKQLVKDEKLQRALVIAYTKAATNWVEDAYYKTPKVQAWAVCSRSLFAVHDLLGTYLYEKRQLLRALETEVAQ